MKDLRIVGIPAKTRVRKPPHTNQKSYAVRGRQKYWDKNV